MRSRFFFPFAVAVVLSASLALPALADPKKHPEAGPTDGVPSEASSTATPAAAATAAPEPGLEPTPAPTAATNPPPAATPALPRPMADMHGKCANYGLNLSEEFKRWDERAFVVRAGTTADSAGLLESGKRMEITLEHEDKVRLAVRPEKPSKHPASVYGGMVRFRVPKDGTYRVAAGNRLWLEVVNARLKQRVPEATFEMQTKCPSIAKVIVYDLKSGENYWLQLSNSDAKRAQILVHAAPAN